MNKYQLCLVIFIFTGKLSRQSEIGDLIPIIAISSYAMTGDKEKALESGCTAYIEKPIELETIMDNINRYL